MARRPRHILRGWRRLRHDGRSLWVRQPLQPRLRHQYRRPQHRPLQQRAQLRCVLRDEMQRRSEVVPPGLHRRHRHQLLPAELRPLQRQRRLVQSSPPAFRSRRARLPSNRPIPCRNCPRLVPQGPLRKEGRDPIHDQRARLLQLGAHQQRRRCRRRARGVDQGIEDWVAIHVAQLGSELAEQFVPHRAEPLLPGHHQRRTDRHQLQRRAGRVELRADVPRGAALKFGIRRGGGQL